MEEGYLRPAVEEDMDLLFVWTNEPAVRRNSFSTAEISYEEHKQWYHRLLQREDCRQYIYMYEGTAVGQVRVTVEGDTAELGYSVCAERRGMGHGEQILTLIAGQIEADFPEVKRVIGKVKTENVASQRAFLNTGYTESCRVYELCVGEKNAVYKG